MAQERAVKGQKGDILHHFLPAKPWRHRAAILAVLARALAMRQRLKAELTLFGTVGRFGASGVRAVPVVEGVKAEQRPILYLKIFGERNTGSNYLHRVCAQNFLVVLLQGDVREIWGLGWRIAQEMGNPFAVRQALHDMEIRRILRSDFGWKHAAPDLDVIDASDITKYTRFVVLTKHPYSWLKSLHRNPYSFTPPDADFSQFIRGKFPVNISDGLPGVQPCTPPALLRHKALAYRRLLESAHDVVHLRYEDLIQDFAAAMQATGARMFRKTETFINFDKDVKGQRRQLSDFQRQYSLDAVKKGLRQEDIAFSRSEVGEDVFAFLGYQS